MSKTGWIILGIFIIGFFGFFGLQTFTYWNMESLNSDVILELASDKRNIVLAEEEGVVTFNYSAKNMSDTDFLSDKYFYRLLISRNFDAPGFILKEFTKDLRANEKFTSEFVWEIDKNYADGGTFGVYFNMYEDRDFDDPIIVSSAKQSLGIQYPAKEDLSP